jgi:PhnB protein
MELSLGIWVKLTRRFVIISTQGSVIVICPEIPQSPLIFVTLAPLPLAGNGSDNIFCSPLFNFIIIEQESFNHFGMKNPVKDAVISCSIAPWLSVRNSVKALAFYKAAFGATETYRLDMPDSVVAKLSVNGAEFWLGDESPEHGNFSPETLNGSSVRIILTVPDPDAVFAQAISAGASEVYPVGEEHGWRLGRVVDPFGHHWEIGRQIPED